MNILKKLSSAAALFCAIALGSQTMAEDRILKVGVDATSAPFCFWKDDTTLNSLDTIEFKALGNEGTLLGFDVDLLTEIFSKEGYTLKFEVMPFLKLFPALDKGRVDLVASGISITPERSDRYLMSSPYYESGFGVMSFTARELTDFIGDQDSRICVKRGTVGRDFVHNNLSGKVNVSEYSTIREIYSLLPIGVCDALVNDFAILNFYAKTHPESGLKVIPVNISQKTDPYAYMADKKHSELINIINEAIARKKEDGSLHELLMKYSLVN